MTVTENHLDVVVNLAGDNAVVNRDAHRNWIGEVKARHMGDFFAELAHVSLNVDGELSKW